MRVALLLFPALLLAQFHRAEQDREISYWLLAPETHQFKISHDFTITRPGQKYAHSFVRKGSKVSPDTVVIDVDTGATLKTSLVSGKQVNALGYYPESTEPDSVVVQAELSEPVREGTSTRVRVIETYTDPSGFRLDNGELVWERTLGRPINFVTLPDGWKLSSVTPAAVVSEDAEGRIRLRLINIRSDELKVAIRARRR